MLTCHRQLWERLHFSSLYKHFAPLVPGPQGCFYPNTFPLCFGNKGCLSCLQSMFPKQRASLLCFTLIAVRNPKNVQNIQLLKSFTYMHPSLMIIK